MEDSYFKLSAQLPEILTLPILWWLSEPRFPQKPVDILRATKKINFEIFANVVNNNVVLGLRSYVQFDDTRKMHWKNVRVSI